MSQHRLRSRHFAACACAATALIVSPIAGALAQTGGTFGDQPSERVPMTFAQQLRVGTENGVSDAFARVAYVMARRDGGVLVADDEARQVSWFDMRGRLVRRVGRQGRGPGEYERPWLISVGTGDSVFVYDFGLSRINVYSPQLVYARSFPSPSGAVVSSLIDLPNGQLLMAAYNTRSRQGLQLVTRTGTFVRGFAPIPSQRGLSRFDASLLGGTAILMDDRIVYSHHSPYRIDTYSLEGKLLRTCRGSASATSDPASVVEIRADGTRKLNWGAYVHSTALATTGMPNRVLNVIADRTSDKRVLDVVDIDKCTLLRRAVIDSPTFFTQGANGLIAGFMELDFPEVVLYHLASTT